MEYTYLLKYSEHPATGPYPEAQKSCVHTPLTFK